jgi:hypothetical protein
MGIDPSYKGFGLSFINSENKTITFKELSVELGHGTFAEVCKASEDMVDKFLTEAKDFIRCNVMIGMEIPPVQGMYAVKLWALDTHIYNSLVFTEPYLFNVSYLKFINKKYEGKKDTINMINQILESFKDNGYTIIQDLKDKKGKPRKLTSNECDSFIYTIRMFVKYHYDNGIENPMLAEIININDKFLVEKETLLGKKIVD